MFVISYDLHKLKVLLSDYTYVSKHNLGFFNKSRSPVDAMNKVNIFNVDDLISSSKLEIFKFFSLQLHEILILLQYGSL